MSKQNPEAKTIRTRNRPTPVARRPLSGDANPFAFERQLAAAARRTNNAATPTRLQSLFTRLRQCSFIQRIQRLGKRLFKRRCHRRKLDIVEIQQLGEKRFVAIVRVGKQNFLIAGAAASVSLLAEIEGRRVTPIASRPLGQERA